MTTWFLVVVLPATISSGVPAVTPYPTREDCHRALSAAVVDQAIAGRQVAFATCQAGRTPARPASADLLR